MLTPASIGARLLGLAFPAAVARKFALPGFILACLLVLCALWSAWQAFDWFNDREAVEDAVNEANADFRENLDQATGRADVDSQGRREQFEARQRTTQELIDEALEKGCAVGDYIASNGAVCLRGPADPRPPADPE